MKTKLINILLYLIVLLTAVTVSNGYAEVLLETPGWHLISPGNIEDLDTLLAEQPNLKSIWHWNSDYEHWEVKFQNPSLSHYYPELQNMENKKE